MGTKRMATTKGMAATTRKRMAAVEEPKRRPKPNRPFGQFIKRMAIDAEVTPTQLAEHCGVSRGAVSNWFETGSMTKMNLVKVAERLGTSVEQLMNAYNATNGVPPPDPTMRRPTDAQVAHQMALAQGEMRRSVHSPRADELAWVYDHLATDELRAKLLLYAAQLEVGNPLLKVVIQEPPPEVAPPAAPAPAAPRSRPRTSAPPKSGRRQKSRLSRA